MKKLSVFSVIGLCITVVLLFSVFPACDTGVVPVDPADLVGVWIGAGEGADEAYAVLLDLSETEYEYILYENTGQIEGARGTYTITGNIMTSSLTEVWNNETYAWDSETGTDDSEVSLNGNEFTMPHMVQEGETVALTKVSFGNPGTFEDMWIDPSQNTMALNADGSYEYHEGEDTSTGDWYATENAANNHYRSIQTQWNGADEYYENLYYYEFSDNDNIFTLTWPTAADYIWQRQVIPQ